MSDISERVSNVVVAKLHIPANRVTQSASFIDDLAATSLDVVETIMSLEDEFGIEISDRDAEKLQTVGDVIALIRTKVHFDGIPTPRREQGRRPSITSSACRKGPGLRRRSSIRATPGSSSGSRRS